MTFTKLELHQLRQALSDKINFAQSSSNISPYEELYDKVCTMIKEIDATLSEWGATD